MVGWNGQKVIFEGRWRLLTFSCYFQDGVLHRQLLAESKCVEELDEVRVWAQLFEVVESGKEVQDIDFAWSESFSGVAFADLHVEALHDRVLCAFVFYLGDVFDKLFEIGQICACYLLDDLLFILLVHIPSLLVLDDDLLVGLKQPIQQGFLF